MKSRDGGFAANTFYGTITLAVNDLIEHGYDSAERVSYWIDQIRRAALADLVPAHILEASLRNSLGVVYRRLVEKGGMLKYHPGVSTFTLERVRPQLRAELDRRIMASANLIKLNRENAIAHTLQRFSGWATSIPAGGTDVAQRVEVKKEMRKSLVSLPFEERRVDIDQGHKFVSALNDILAVDGGALAAVWHSHWRQVGYYDYRPDHKDRDERVYLVRDNWAQERGLIKAGPDGYTDERTMPGEEVYCRCYYTYLYALRDLPPDMLTAKGRAELARVRIAA